MIFEIKRLRIRNLKSSDLNAFHEMQSNAKVMQFVDGDVKTKDENKKELNDLIEKYNIEKNDFWIYAIERKLDSKFIGTLALVKDDNDDEIGYRFLEKYWGLGFGSEACEGLITYCKNIGLTKIVGYVADENIASKKILENNNFIKIASYVNDKKEMKYELIL